MKAYMDDLQEAQRLYENACEKSRALVEYEPENAAVWRAYGQALLQLGLALQTTQPADAQACWQVHLLITFWTPGDMPQWRQNRPMTLDHQQVLPIIG